MTATQNVVAEFRGARNGARTAIESVPGVRLDTPVDEVARIMVDRQVRSLPVVDGAGDPAGVITMADLLARVGDDPIFAGLDRRRWWRLPVGATVADVLAPADERAPAVVHRLFPADERHLAPVAAAGG